jgi:hypothetical protein
MAKRSIEDKLQESINHWQYLYQFGGHDPFWSDGCNLNLVRNHISRYKEQIEELYPNGDYPEAYYQDTPPEVSNDYMARTEEIKENAENILAVCKKDPNYNELLFTVLKLNAKIQEQTSINNVIWYVKGLEKAILQNDLISMRRANAESYISAFKDCIERVKGLYQHEEQQGQLSLF